MGDRLHRCKVKGPEMSVERVEATAIVVFEDRGADDTLGEVLHRKVVALAAFED